MIKIEDQALILLSQFCQQWHSITNIVVLAATVYIQEVG